MELSTHDCTDCNFYVATTIMPYPTPLIFCNRKCYIDNSNSGNKVTFTINPYNERMDIPDKNILALYPDDYEPCGVEGKFFEQKPEPPPVPEKESLLKKLKGLLCRT